MRKAHLAILLALLAGGFIGFELGYIALPVLANAAVTLASSGPPL